MRNDSAVCALFRLEIKRDDKGCDLPCLRGLDCICHILSEEIGRAAGALPSRDRLRQRFDIHGKRRLGGKVPGGMLAHHGYNPAVRSFGIMQIRDSVCQTGPEMEKRHGGLLEHPCLLYTSDAADEEDS